MNNLAFTQQWLTELDKHLDWSSIISGMKHAHNEREATKSEETLRQFCEHAQDVLLTKVDEMIYHIGEKVWKTDKHYRFTFFHSSIDSPDDKTRKVVSPRAIISLRSVHNQLEL